MTPTYRISIFNNYLLITSADLVDFNGLVAPAKSVRINPSIEDAETFEFWNLDGRNTMWNRLHISQLLDENDNPFDIGSWETFYTINTSQYGGSSSSDASLSNIEADLNTLVGTQNVGIVTTGILSPSLPYTIADATYNSFTIVTSGSVSIDGVTVPSGVSYSYSCQSNETLTGLELTTSGGGTVIILTQEKA